MHGCDNNKENKEALNVKEYKMWYREPHREKGMEK